MKVFRNYLYCRIDHADLSMCGLKKEIWYTFPCKEGTFHRLVADSARLFHFFFACCNVFRLSVSRGYWIVRSLLVSSMFARDKPHNDARRRQIYLQRRLQSSVQHGGLGNNSIKRQSTPISRFALENMRLNGLPVAFRSAFQKRLSKNLRLVWR